MRKKAKGGIRTFALTADVAEAHRQIPKAKCDWHLLGCQVNPGGRVYVNTAGTFRSCVRFVLLVPCLDCPWQTVTVLGWRTITDLAHACCRRLPPRIWR